MASFQRQVPKAKQTSGGTESLFGFKAAAKRDNQELRLSDMVVGGIETMPQMSEVSDNASELQAVEDDDSVIDIVVPIINGRLKQEIIKIQGNKKKENLDLEPVNLSLDVHNILTKPHKILSY